MSRGLGLCLAPGNGLKDRDNLCPCPLSCPLECGWGGRRWIPGCHWRPAAGAVACGVAAGRGPCSWGPSTGRGAPALFITGVPEDIGVVSPGPGMHLPDHIFCPQWERNLQHDAGLPGQTSSSRKYGFCLPGGSLPAQLPKTKAASRSERGLCGARPRRPGLPVPRAPHLLQRSLHQVRPFRPAAPRRALCEPEVRLRCPPAPLSRGQSPGDRGRLWS